MIVTITRKITERCGLLPTNEESDWLTRQIRAFAEGMGYLLARDKNGASTEVIFPQKESELAYQSELQSYLDQQAYGQASARIFELQYALPTQQFLQLGLWLYRELNKLSEVELARGHFSKQEMMNSLRRLRAITQPE